MTRRNTASTEGRTREDFRKDLAVLKASANSGVAAYATLLEQLEPLLQQWWDVDGRALPEAVQLQVVITVVATLTSMCVTAGVKRGCERQLARAIAKEFQKSLVVALRNDGKQQPALLAQVEARGNA